MLGHELAQLVRGEHAGRWQVDPVPIDGVLLGADAALGVGDVLAVVELVGRAIVAPNVEVADVVSVLDEEGRERDGHDRNEGAEVAVALVGHREEVGRHLDLGVVLEDVGQVGDDVRDQGGAVAVVAGGRVGGVVDGERDPSEALGLVIAQRLVDAHHVARRHLHVVVRVRRRRGRHIVVAHRVVGCRRWGGGAIRQGSDLL